MVMIHIYPWLSSIYEVYKDNAGDALHRRKSTQVEAQLKELGLESLEERMQSAVQVPLNPPYRLSRLIAETVPQVRKRGDGGRGRGRAYAERGAGAAQPSLQAVAPHR